MSNLKILLADDEVIVVDILTKRLKQEGYSIVSAYDGEDAWQKIKTESPDIIVMDLGMPKKSGFEVLKELRTNPPSAKWQPVIIISGHNELSDVQEGYTLEADHYLVKPCSFEDIHKAIRLMAALIPQRKKSSETS